MTAEKPSLEPRAAFREFSEGRCSAGGASCFDGQMAPSGLRAPPHLQEVAVTSQGLRAGRGPPHQLAQREDQPFAAPMIPALLVFEGDRFSVPGLFMDHFSHDPRVWRRLWAHTQWQGRTDPGARFPHDDGLQNRKAQGRRHGGHGASLRPPRRPDPTRPRRPPLGFPSPNFRHFRNGA